MNTLVKVVPKHPETFRDASGVLVGAEPVSVDPRDQFWRRVIKWGDVEVVQDAVAKPALATASNTSVAASAPVNGSKS